MGFPSEIVDDPLLSLVSPEEEAFQNAEERRVMYVAMTRARHTLTILASNARPSSFVTELRKDPAYGISTAPRAEPEAHVCGECGGRLLGVTGQDGRGAREHRWPRFQSSSRAWTVTAMPMSAMAISTQRRVSK